LSLRTGMCVMDVSDGELVARVRAGDVEAYRGLVERHYADCLRYATRMLGNDADAEEAVQDAFARAYRFLNRFDENRKFKGWLFGILLNRCRTSGATRHHMEGALVSIDELDSTTAPYSADAALDLDLQRALMMLEPQQRETLLLKYADDWTYEEIAEATGARVSALKMRVKRARAQLVELLRGAYDVT
jgi:RNA polymerase sigma-70 factor (ECF subfamily)